MPAQVTWRADEGLIARTRMQAVSHGLSMNEYITQVLRTVTDPTYAASPSEQVRERLRVAGLLTVPEPVDDAGIDWAEVERASAEAATGTAVSDLAIEGR